MRPLETTPNGEADSRKKPTINQEQIVFRITSHIKSFEQNGLIYTSFLMTLSDPIQNHIPKPTGCKMKKTLSLRSCLRLSRLCGTKECAIPYAS